MLGLGVGEAEGGGEEQRQGLTIKLSSPRSLFLAPKVSAEHQRE